MAKGIYAEANKEPTDKPVKGEYYAIIGTNAPNPETGVVEFIGLPQGMALDTMNRSRILGDGDFQKTLCAGNDLLEQLVEFARTNLAPGESQEVKLVVKIYRKKGNSAEINHEKRVFNLTGE